MVHGIKPQKRYNAYVQCEVLLPNRAPKIPAKINVKIAIITTGVTTAQTIPSTEPLYLVSRSLFASDQISSLR
jgi:hypothetical protein